MAAWLRELEFPLNTRTGLWARGMAWITWLVTVLMVVLPNWPMVPVLPMKEVCGAEKLGFVDTEEARAASVTLEFILISQGKSTTRCVDGSLTTRRG